VSLWADTVPALYFVVPPAKATSSEQDAARLALQHHAQSLGWRCVTNRTIAIRLAQSKNSGRTLHLLQPQDAGDLYRVAHRHPTVVVQIGPAEVRLDPSAPPSARNTISLARFVRYKAFFQPLGRPKVGLDVGGFLHDFDVWRSVGACDGERDARCIPLHVFSPSREWADLHDAAGVKLFEERHGRPNSRRDNELREWNSPNALHGLEAMTIAGTRLRSGFHWDVVSSDGAGRLCTSTEVWGFTRGSYCNVYPDAAVRQGQRRGRRAKRVYAAERPATTITITTDTPRTRRRHR